MQHGTFILEGSLVVSCLTKPAFIIQSSKHASWHFPKVENLHPYENLHTNVYISFTQTGKTWKKPRCPSEGEWIKQLWYIQSGILFTVKQVSNPGKDMEEIKCILLSERSQSKKATYSTISTI